MDIAILRYFGLAGTLIVMVTSGAAAAIYRGKHGERFSVLNHFVSELGELGVSKGARFFNLGLLLGGILLVPFLLSLGLALNSWLGWLGTLAGAAAGLSLAAVGIFPMNDLEKHSRAALAYFRSGLGMVCLYGLAFFFQSSGEPVVPQTASILSLLSAACYAGFLLMTGKAPEENADDVLEPDEEKERPRVWALPVVEWLVFFSTVGWLFLIAFSV